MKTIELKNILKSRIDCITDNDFLNALNTILESKTQDIIILSEAQKLVIKNSQKEYLEGNYIENDTVNEEMEKWLREE
jgi:UDP-N-acetyl-D-mannosaminuronic acid transferase (WecB/TagA/CpsF family)